MNDEIPDIEQLKKKHKELEKLKTTAEANLATSTQTLDAFKQEAREKYGTDDLEQLKIKLEQLRQENDRKRAQYHAHLKSIESRLAEVEAQFTAPKPA